VTRLQEQELRKLTRLLGALLIEQIETNRLIVELLTNQQEEHDDDAPQRDLTGKPIRYT
jgi:hypothetical protein